MQSTLSHLLSKFIQFSSCPHPKLRARALSCMNHFISSDSPVVSSFVDAYIEALAQRATDEAGEVRKHVCHAFVLLLECRADVLIPRMAPIIEFMLFATQDADDQVSLEACEFWLAFAEKDVLHAHLKPHLDRLIPILMKGMIYSEFDAAIYEGEDRQNQQVWHFIDVFTRIKDASVPDRDQDIKPRHHKAKTHASEAQENPQKSSTDHEGQDDDEDDDEDDEEIYAEWNLRKCSAATLDVISNVFGNDILKILLPNLNQQLFHEEWKHREAGILALGAIAEGLPLIYS